jgi:hypothetical protein
LPPLAGELLAEQLIGQFGLGDRGPAPQVQCSAVPIASSRRSTSVSTRLTKNDATLCAVDGSPPRSTSASSPDRYASMICRYRVREKIRVMLMLRPSAIIARTAGTPSAVAGIFTNRFGAAIRSCSFLAAAVVASVSRATSAATSSDAKPSVPPLASNTGRSTASAAVTSSTTSCQ